MERGARLGVAMRRFHYLQAAETIREVVVQRAPRFGAKLGWFLHNGYVPHPYQLAFHTLCHDAGAKSGRLLRFRMLAAGRRGGKTMSAAWETIFYALHPEHYWRDAHGTDNDEPLHIWVLVPNFKSSGRAAMRTIAKAFRDAGLKPGEHFKWNRGENYIEFANGSFLEFKTAEQADQLIGAGIHILWVDEAATIPNEDAYEYASPALDDNMGIVWGTTTPRGKNWFFKTFWGPQAQKDDEIGSVEYRSIDNPHFPSAAWAYRKKHYHPLRFKQEYEAAFDSTAGKELSGEWLHYYELDDLPLKDPNKGVLRTDGTMRLENLALDFYVGVDPASSLNDRADHFAVSIIGVAENMDVFLLDTIKTRIAFHEQVTTIQQLHYRWRPHYFGVDATAYQAVLAQQLQRLPSLPPVIPVYTQGKKKSHRILAMAPVFTIGKVRVRSDHKDFIDEWINYDSELRNPEDDLLDATEIALGTAGILLAGLPQAEDEQPASSMDELAERLRRGMVAASESTRALDETLGSEW